MMSSFASLDFWLWIGFSVLGTALILARIYFLEDSR